MVPDLDQQRLDVADRVKVLAYHRTAPGILVLDQFIVGAAVAKCGGHMLGGQHAAAHRVVNALDARNIDKPAAHPISAPPAKLKRGTD